MMPYCIKNIPNTKHGHEAAKILRSVGECHHRKRGRGARCPRHYQDLPLERATHFSFYGYPVTGAGVYCGIWKGQYFTFEGWADGKPVIRQLNKAVR
jgi:hypothetical protein